MLTLVLAFVCGLLMFGLYRSDVQNQAMEADLDVARALLRAERLRSEFLLEKINTRQSIPVFRIIHGGKNHAPSISSGAGLGTCDSRGAEDSAVT